MEKRNWKKEVKRTISELEKTDKNWIKKQNWYKKLEEFELGDNFYVSCLLTNTILYDILMEIECNLSKIRQKDFDIKYGRLAKTEKEQKFLDFEWWKQIFKLTKNTFNPKEKKVLINIQEHFNRTICSLKEKLDK